MRAIHPIKWLAIVCTTVFVVHLMYMLEVIEHLGRRWPESYHKADNIVKENANRNKGNALMDNTTKEEVNAQHPKEAVLPDDNSKWMSNKSLIFTQWQENVISGRHAKKTRYFVTVAIRVRIHKKDKAKWTIKELKQWLHYLFYAGVEHVYLCDHFLSPEEELQSRLHRYINAKLLTYIPWNNEENSNASQNKCYQSIIDRYGNCSVWQIAIDMDEYPYVLSDISEGFLIRYLQTLNSSISEVAMGNFLMLGQGDRSKTLVIERITRMKPEKANKLDKPIYRPTKVRAAMHHNVVLEGKAIKANPMDIRILHYWGARLQHWGPDTDKTFWSTIEYNQLATHIGPIIRQSLISYNEYDAFSNSTGP